VKYLKHVARAATTLGVLSLAMSASADTYIPNFPVVEVHGLKGQNSSSSFAASAIMGEKGFSNTYNGVAAATPTSLPPAGWEDAILVSCKLKTQALFPTSVWPSTCNPDGMAAALNTLDAHALADWIVLEDVNTAAGKAHILDWIASSLADFGSPAVIPIYGQADHWVAVKQVDATMDPVTFLYTISSVSFFDGGPLGTDPTNPPKDSQLHPYLRGLQTFSAATFAQIYFGVVTAINPICDTHVGGCGASPQSDPYYNQYLLVFDPPVRPPHPTLNASFEKAPGIVPAGHGVMNAEKAQHGLCDALVAAGINKDPATWAPLSGAVPGPAVLVNGVFPDGSPWNYYLVPVLQDASTAVAFVQLSADDGSFQHIQIFPGPVPYTPVAHTRAKQLASGVLAKGDRLTTDGVLTWNPRSDPELARSPNAPYYEFGVIDANGKTNTARVLIHGGTTVRGRFHDGAVVRQ
jgi:hypothetical protein